MTKQACDLCKPWGFTALRVILGLILIAHGYPKLFGDTTGTLAFFQSTVLPAPYLMLKLAGIIELVGGALLVLGLFTKVVAVVVAVQFLVIVLFVKLQMGFAKLEFDLLILATAFALSSAGAGAWALDNIWEKRGQNEKSQKGGHNDEAISG